MDPVTFRKGQGLSQAEFAEALGLGANSKGYISRLEAADADWPLALALRLESISNGQVPAIRVSSEARELGATTKATAQPAEARP